MTPTTIYVKTKEMCENFPGKVDPPKKCVKRTICAQILSAKTAPKDTQANKVAEGLFNPQF
jgi:hypothetical protein